MELRRIVRDLDDGVIAISMDGNIRAMNPRAVQLLGVGESYAGRPFSDLSGQDTLNSEFYQMIAHTKSDYKVLRKKMKYLRGKDSVEYFDVTSSVLWDEEHKNKECVFVSFNDCTESEVLKDRVKDSSSIFLLFLSLVSIWVFVVMAWQGLGKPFRADYLSKALVLLLFIPVPFIEHWTKFSLEDFGLKFKWRYILEDFFITLLLIAFMCLAKVVIRRLVPGYFDDSRFVLWDKSPLSEYLMYIVSVIAQEFITRGVVHETINYVVESKHKKSLSIIVSSLLFGAMHLHLGITYMASAAFLLGMLGLVYNRQKSIWGLCIPHYVLGFLLGLLGFVAY